MAFLLGDVKWVHAESIAGNYTILPDRICILHTQFSPPAVSVPPGGGFSTGAVERMWSRLLGIDVDG
jgi:hypothetical protein